MATLVREAMIKAPKTLPANASIEDVHTAFCDDHVHMVLLTEGRTLVGTLLRTDLPSTAANATAARPWSTLSGRTVAPEEDAETVRQLLVRRGARRLAVVGDDKAILGLLCLKRSGAGFCSDADVASR